MRALYPIQNRISSLGHSPFLGATTMGESHSHKSSHRMNPTSLSMSSWRSANSHSLRLNLLKRAHLHGINSLMKIDAESSKGCRFHIAKIGYKTILKLIQGFPPLVLHLLVQREGYKSTLPSSFHTVACHVTTDSGSQLSTSSTPIYAINFSIST